jgi:hypothetical protein
MSSVGLRVHYFLQPRDHFLNLGTHMCHSIEGVYRGMARIQAAQERVQ